MTRRRRLARAVATLLADLIDGALYALGDLIDHALTPTASAAHGSAYRPA